MHSRQQLSRFFFTFTPSIQQRNNMRKLFTAGLLLLSAKLILAQPLPFNEEKDHYVPGPEDNINISALQWLPKSHDFWVNDKNNIYVYNADDLGSKKLLLSAEQITASGLTTRIESIVWNNDKKKILIYTNSKRVWRANTMGDYWYFDLSNGSGKKIGKTLPVSSLMFAKFSPDNKNRCLCEQA